MKSKSLLALSMTACVIATGCNSTSVPESTSTEAITRPEMALEDTNTTDNTENTQEKESDILMTDASQYVSSIENSNIDPALYLDYSAGIEAGVYKWILSEDENYYILAALDEKGEPIEAVQKAINVGANNQESIDLAGGDKKGDGAGQRQGG
ncbi:MAG: hypothetical protein K6A76_07160, partial [Oribacterium sp.]|nr:hypothetical protein [Oribacterium sp.]